MAKPKVSTILWIIVTIILVVAVGVLANMLNQTQAALQQKTGELVTMTDERDSVQQELDKSNAENADLSNNVKAMDQEVARLKDELSQSNDKSDGLSRELNAKNNELTSAKNELNRLGKEKNALAVELVKVKQDSESTKDLLSQVRSAKDALESKIKELMAQKEVELGKVVVQPAGEQPMQLQGQVLSLNKKYNFAVINLGKNDGVLAGMKFEVKIDDETIAQLQVEKVYDTMSAANIISSKKEIRKGYLVNSI